LLRFLFFFVIRFFIYPLFAQYSIISILVSSTRAFYFFNCFSLLYAKTAIWLSGFALPFLAGGLGFAGLI